MPGVSYTKKMRDRAKREGTALFGVGCVTGDGTCEMYGPGLSDETAGNLFSFCSAVQGGMTPDEAFEEVFRKDQAGDAAEGE